MAMEPTITISLNTQSNNNSDTVFCHGSEKQSLTLNCPGMRIKIETETSVNHENGENILDINELVLEILNKCSCVTYAKYFQRMDKKEFISQSLHDIQNRLSNQISHEHTNSGDLNDSSTDAAAAATRIYEEITKFSDIKNQSLPSTSTVATNASPTTVNVNGLSSNLSSNSGQDTSSVNNVSIKEEISNVSQYENSDDDNDDEDYDVPILANSIPDLPKQIEEVDLDLSSDDDDDQQNGKSPAPVNIPIPENPVTVNSRPKRAAALAAVSKYKNKIFNDGDVEDDEDEDQQQSGPSRQKRSRTQNQDQDSETDWDAYVNYIPIIDPSTHIKKLKKEGRDYAEEICTKIHILRQSELGSHNCVNDPQENEIQQWLDFYKKFGPTIKSAKLSAWSWKSNKSLCPFNAFKILNKFCENLEDLIFNVGLPLLDAEEKLLEKIKFSDSKLFPKLKQLVVDGGEADRNGKIPSLIIRIILKVAPNLQVFRYRFENKEDCGIVLQTLVDFSQIWLEKLKCLEIRSQKDDGYLTADEITLLSSLKTKNLQELILGNGLWEDISGPLMEQLFQNFPLLKKLVIYGNFQGNSLDKPTIIIEIPTSLHLEHLEIGGNYEFASVIEASSGNPNNPTSSQDPNHEEEQDNIFNVDEDLKTELFGITLKIRHLPNLQQLILGNLFKIDDLHFSSIPRLKVFRVGSPWHLTLIFPPATARNQCYPLLKELQIPDCLKDESIIQNLPKRFPNLEKCWIFLPSVKVLRTFFKSMADSKMKTLFLKTQFDFESTMETCLLGRPARDSEGSLRCWRDRVKLEKLMKYKMWEKWVSFYNVELPCVKREEFEELEEENYAGLRALKNLEFFHMEHIPRVLKIPKGNEYWMGPKARFRSQTIGFKEYPLSKRCIDQLPLGARQWEWPNFQVWAGDTIDLEVAGGFQSVSSSRTGRDDDPSSSRSGGRSGSGKALKVTIGPAMLQANYKFVQKNEHKVKGENN